MTSGVKPALPQVLMAKTGAEGKAARNRTLQGDFAEALGLPKTGKPPKPADAGADRSDASSSAGPAWPRLASKLDNSIGRTQDVASKLDEPASPKELADKEPAEEKLGTHLKPDSAEAATPPVARQVADAAQAPAPSATPAPAPAAATEQSGTAPRPDASISLEGPPAPADRNAVAEDSKAAAPPSDAARKHDSAAPLFMPMGSGGQAGTIRFEPVARSAAPSETADESQAGAYPDNSAEPAKVAPRVTVLAQQSVPAPMPSTSVILVESIAAGDLLEPARNTPAIDAIHASATHASAQSLKIQLHPAELGMVTATLRFAGEQLSIELRVENHDAYRQLSNDSDTIVGSLRDLGYEVDRVTVLQPQIASTPAGRTDTGASMPSPQGRAPDQFGSGAAGAGNGGSGGRQSGEGGNSGRGQQNPAPAREQQGGGLYI